MIDITRNRQVIQVYLSLVRFSNLKIANQDNNLLTTMIIDDPTTNYCRSVEDICILIISRFDRLMFLFRDTEGDIMRLNGEIKLQLTTNDMYDLVPFLIPPMNQFIMIEVLGNTTKEEAKLGNPPFHSISVPTRPCRSMPISWHNVPADQVVVINAGSTPQEVKIPQGAYDIKTIIAMLNESDAFPVK